MAHGELRYTQTLILNKIELILYDVYQYHLEIVLGYVIARGILFCCRRSSANFMPNIQSVVDVLTSSITVQ